MLEGKPKRLQRVITYEKIKPRVYLNKFTRGFIFSSLYIVKLLLDLDG